MLHLILHKVKQSLSPVGCLLAAIFLSVTLLAQQPIRGKVSDAATGAALARATIIAKPGKTATLSTDDGSFTINLDASAKNIVVSYTGYETRTIAINPGTAYYSIVLQPVQRETVVTVIGSRNPSRTNVQSPVPVDIIPVAAMAKQLAQTDVQQLLTYTAPSFQSARQAVADGTDHIDPAQLRGLGSDQLLVLINGKRRHQAALVNVNGTVNRGQAGTDLGAIPVEAIERIEVLRDGAAAQYGSDAIAGVINIVLKKTVQQLSGNISAGENSTRYNKDYALSKLGMTGAGNKHVQDGGNFVAGLNYGFSLNHKGFINLTGNYSLRDKTNRSGTYTGPLYANINGANRDDSILAARGLSRNNFDMRIGNSSMSSAAFMLNAAYALSRQWQLQLVAGYSSKQGEAAGFFRYPSSITTGAGIYADKVFALYPNGFLPLIKSHIKDISFSAGINGAVGKWKAILSNTFGVNHFDFTIANSVNYTQFATGNNVPTKFDAGGLQFLQNTINLDFTRHLAILQGLHIAQGAEYRIDQYTQRAGEEASYRNYNTASGAASGAQVFAGFVPDYARQHARHNIALYADLEQDLSSHWLIQAALRFENYSDFGSTLNYKIASRYKLGEHFSIRASASTGFRAPSVQQQYYAKTNTLFVSSNGNLLSVESGTFTNNSKPAQILGIPPLKEETSRNYAAGFSATPAKGLKISVDGYLININNRIVLTNNFTGGTDTALTRLLKENGATTANFFTNAIDTKSRGLELVLQYHRTFWGQHQFRITGAATFIKNEVKKGADGKPIIKASDVLLRSGQLGNYFNREDQSRIEVANPTVKANLSLSYNHKGLAVLCRLAYFGKVTYLDPGIDPGNPASFPVNAFTGQKETLDQVFSPKTITDLSVSYNLTRSFTLTAGANNLFDVYQDEQTHSGNVSLGRFIYSRRVEQMGFNGRYLFTRLSFNIHQ